MDLKKQHEYFSKKNFVFENKISFELKIKEVHVSQEISLTIPHSWQMNFDECWLQSFK